jgi:hypothetical protein
VSGTRYRRARGIRAFAGKGGGWTLLSRAGEPYELRNAASLALWEALAAGDDLDGLAAALRRVFPRVARRTLRRDAARFVRDLAGGGFVERLGRAPRAPAE